MQVAARPYFATGIALIGVGAIAISPVAPPIPDIQVPASSSAQVNLSAATDPIQAYTDLVTNTITNAIGAISTELANPVPILRQVVANQAASASNIAAALLEVGESLSRSLDPENQYGLTAQFQAAFQDLLDGNIDQAVATAWQGVLFTAIGLLPVLPAIQNAIEQPVGNLDKILKDPSIVPIAALGLIIPVYGALSTSSLVAQDIVDAVRAGDPLGLASAVIAGPARVTDAVLDGVLSPTDGLLGILQGTRETIAEHLKPATTLTGAVAAAPQSKATNTVTLDVSPQAAAAVPEEPTADVPDENVPVAADSTDGDGSVGGNTAVVKDSLKAEPGKTGALSGQKRANPFKQAREGIQGAVKDVSDGFKKATEGLGGKHKRSESGTDKTKSASSASGSSSNAA